MQFFRFLAVLMCAEWLLIFHVWVSFRYLLVFAVFCYLRGHILAFIPHWDTYYFVFLLAALGVLYHLRSMWRGRSARYRDFYTTPDSRRSLADHRRPDPESDAVSGICHHDGLPHIT